MKKTNVMIFQKCPRCQVNKHDFTINKHVIAHSMSYTYLGITITASGGFNMAVNALKEKAWKALHAIKRKCYNFQIPVKIWLKIFDSVIQPIALYSNEVWGPLSHQSYTHLDKYPTKSFHAEFCRFILHVHRNTPTNACRAELGRYPLIQHSQANAQLFQPTEIQPPRNPLLQSPPNSRAEPRVLYISWDWG